jgi:hypothetical protein
MSAVATLAVILALAIAAQLVVAYRGDDRAVERWARERDLELTPDNRPLLARYLRRARRFRTWGAIAGALVPTVFDYLINGRVQVLGFGTDGESAPLGFGSIFVGYLVGAALCEASLVRRPQARRRVAALHPRELPAYLPRWVIVAQRAATVSAAAGLIAIAAVPFPDRTSDPGAFALTVGALVVLAFGTGLEAVERWLVRRPQPFAAPDLVAADDAVRAQSIRAVAGAGLALLLLLCCGVALALQASDVDVLHVAMVAPAVLCLILSLAAYAAISNGAWRVGRPTRATAASA